MQSWDLETSASDSFLDHNDSLDYKMVVLTQLSAKTTMDLFKKLVDSNEESLILPPIFKSKEIQIILVSYLFLTFAERCQYVLILLIYSASIVIGGLDLTLTTSAQLWVFGAFAMW